MQKQQLIHTGKAKSVYMSNETEYYIMYFKDDATAFNGEKKASLEQKGQINNHFNAHIMSHLADHGIACHFIRTLSKHESLVKALTMLPVECVVRNYAAGSICRRLGLKSGFQFPRPIFEFFYKSDKLGDPMVNESHIETMGWAESNDIATMKQLTLKVNDLLTALFQKAGICLVDYKLEFGKDNNGMLVLGDEFTPDGCRLWDIETWEVMDKDRFRQDMNDVIGHYIKIAQRLGISGF